MQDIVVEFDIDSAQAEKHLKNTMKVMTDIKKSMKELSKLSKGGFVDLAKSGDSLHGFFSTMQKMGSDMENFDGKIAAVGKSFENVARYGKVFADAFKVGGAIAEITGLDEHLQEFLGKNTKTAGTFNSEYADICNNMVDSFSSLAGPLGDLGKDMEALGGKVGKVGTKISTVGQVIEAFKFGWDIGRAIAEAFNLAKITIKEEVKLIQYKYLHLFKHINNLGTANSCFVQAMV